MMPITRNCRPPTRTRAPKGIFAAEQLVLQLRPEHHLRARAAGFFLGQELAAPDLALEYLQHAGADTIDRDAAHPAVAIDLGVAPDAGGHGDHVGQALQGLGVVQRQRPRAARQARQRATAGFRLARMDADDVGAELGELGQHVAVDALADRGQQDHRGDADGDAEQGQEAAQALCADGADGEGEGVGEDHSQTISRRLTQIKQCIEHECAKYSSLENLRKSAQSADKLFFIFNASSTPAPDPAAPRGVPA
jgi:hypothetical protein